MIYLCPWQSGVYFCFLLIFFNVDNLQMDVCVLCREIFCFILVGSLCLFV